MKNLCVLAAVAATIVASPALATSTTVTTLDGSQGFAAPPGELNGGSTATITSSTALSSDGSLELTGDRSRVLNGNNYAPTGSYGLANGLVSFTGDYMVLNGGTGGIQSPAFRLYIQDGAQRSELIWEAAYNGGYTLNSIQHVSASDLFWQYIAGSGPTGGGSYVMHTVADWGSLYSANAYISAFGVGAGSGAGASFDALADNLALTNTRGSRTTNLQSVNFAATGAVPEPATWAMMLIGFGGIGFAARRKRGQQTVTA